MPDRVEHNLELTIVLALELIQSMYPRMVVSQKVLDLTDAWLAGPYEVPGPVRRALLESQDDLRRALKGRAFNRA